MKLFEEWQDRNEQGAKILKRCKAVLCDIVPNAELILYGSSARGKIDHESDIDILVLVNTLVEWNLTDTIRNAIYDISLEENVVISTIIREKSLWMSPDYCLLPLYQNINREGVMVK